MYLIIQNKKWNEITEEYSIIPKSYSIIITNDDRIDYEYEDGDQIEYTYIPMNLSHEGFPKTYTYSNVNSGVYCNFGLECCTDYFEYNHSKILSIECSDDFIIIYAMINSELYISSLDISKILYNRYNSNYNDNHRKIFKNQIMKLLLDGKVDRNNVHL